MAWMETDYSKDTHFRWKIKWRLEHLGALRFMGEKTLLILGFFDFNSLHGVATQNKFLLLRCWCQFMTLLFLEI